MPQTQCMWPGALPAAHLPGGRLHGARLEARRAGQLEAAPIIRHHVLALAAHLGSRLLPRARPLPPQPRRDGKLPQHLQQPVGVSHASEACALL